MVVDHRHISPWINCVMIVGLPDASTVEALAVILSVYLAVNAVHKSVAVILDVLCPTYPAVEC